MSSGSIQCYDTGWSQAMTYLLRGVCNLTATALPNWRLKIAVNCNFESVFSGYDIHRLTTNNEKYSYTTSDYHI